MHNPVWSARAEFHLLRGVTQNLGILPVGLARKYTDDTHSFIPSASLQGLAERPVPCKYNVIHLGEALSRRKRGFKSRRGRHNFNDLPTKAVG